MVGGKQKGEFKMKELTIKLGELFCIKQTIDANKIMQTTFSKKGNIYIYKNYKAILSELEAYEVKRNEIIKLHSGGDSISPSNPNWDAFVKDLNELDLVEVTFNISTITMDDFPESSTPDTFRCLDFMIELE